MAVNGTSPVVGYLAIVLDSTQTYVANLPGQVIFLTVICSPLIAIVLNIFKQLVCVQ